MVNCKHNMDYICEKCSKRDTGDYTISLPREMFIITAEYQKLEKKDKLEFIAQLIKWCSDELK